MTPLYQMGCEQHVILRETISCIWQRWGKPQENKKVKLWRQQDRAANPKNRVAVIDDRGKSPGPGGRVSRFYSRHPSLAIRVCDCIHRAFPASTLSGSDCKEISDAPLERLDATELGPMYFMCSGASNSQSATRGPIMISDKDFEEVGDHDLDRMLRFCDHWSDCFSSQWKSRSLAILGGIGASLEWPMLLRYDQASRFHKIARYDHGDDSLTVICDEATAALQWSDQDDDEMNQGPMSSERSPLEENRNNAAAERWRLVRRAAADVAELIPAGVASQWMTKFLFQLRSDDFPIIKAEEEEKAAVIARTSPWHLYAACFVFGCSAASFLQRRKAVDGFQIYVFATFVGAGLLLGQLRGASSEAIMLTYVSWAVCVAMLASVACYHIRLLNSNGRGGICR
ncbi:hypothetical protein NLU13_9183 [Sarocladium strictum]|uniref:Uncharacterized protein n=1 Tax=Sarocladium strictum TaxID=5046 RepID=A0AA39L445_SARSR|nr:hypothetical protein NLU13_9183 [Sarocladium strictum]